MKGEPFRAWQPLTFSGVASYAHDWIGRLIFTGLILSSLAVAAVLFTVNRAWVPVVEQSIEKLPPGAEIQGGLFKAPGAILLAENSFLSIRLDPDATLTTHSAAEIEGTFTREEFRLRSLFGVTGFPYPPQWRISLARAEMEPKWGAWKPAVFGYLIAGVVANLFVSWLCLGLLYTLVPRVIALVLKRDLTIWGAFKLSIAALMPGALFFTLAIALYGLSQIRLMELLAAWCMHFVIGWIFIVGAVYRLPPLDHSNPFDKRKERKEESPRPKAKNPFKTKR